jgi:4-hydroxy-tetrahydrodipicolinate synthase
MKTPTKFKGVITAIVTPFKDGALDLASFRRLLKAQLDQGVNGFVINGTTGESPTLTPNEVKTLFETARAEAAGQVPLIVGTGSNSTVKTVEFTKQVCGWNPDAVLVVVPYYNKPPQRGLRQHFEAVAEASTVPVILYNVPGRTITTLEPATVGELSGHANIAGIKDATGDLSILNQIIRERRKDIALLSGDDATCIDFCARGGHGVIAVASHIIGKEMGEAIQQAWFNEASAGVKYKETFGALLKWLYCEANPIPVKKALHMMGLIDSPEMRLPLVELDSKYDKDLQTCLKDLGKI